ncbi:ATP synthase F1 subunit gamma [Candidatus Roizmanbacteria bacterium RIFCSPHIGHO2_02_FULL_40_13b]|uniref:ATP synthase gamma chain n=1 Tax=Candidatus Roizmanbacteria bacterium RIFCSPHIGHO2_01_FULL_39_24 TaxID=1802032 RepID=A0A1F7GGL7_9BACT|nr:MAG: ATP synthase F1 subunit gamma [Candidatus Roizmanbacteria bacterium RIFCSPHIGHO2_01_FULL_39_24]OGK26420.1 MAG: ATP synthase F1 subunit gamma [Candidatus Roizmanbacteria bacterium RIFCSPHIGHO2_02_FULL_40_13b]OGK49032.1 MAG: ATP synthase F1 subunit gamma [Candidatus Roizmanbacteria bacterium RIFCSPLOWO2_01_FULL_40_32]OGK57042.1 MAG: ATP synthase F1 subunit gamma [Candidatus Roizmanbacteria bacterium RIFCSPLOWO2_02_FULL_39_8]
MNFRQVRKKIKTIGNVKKITNAMQMVSAVKMKKAQLTAQEGKLYRQTLEGMINRVLSDNAELKSGLLANKKEGGRNLIIIISSNKGLAGSFHFNLLRFIFSDIDTSKNDFIVLGKKAADFITKIKGTILADFSSEPVFEESASAIFSLAISEYELDNYDSVYLVYNEFKSSFQFSPIKKMLLPVKNVKKNTDEVVKAQVGNYLIEPSAEEIVEPLLIDYLTETIRGAILDSQASEHSARMMAMKNATDSAGEIIDGLTLLRNKLRQASITGELLDMMSSTLSN